MYKRQVHGRAAGGQPGDPATIFRAGDRVRVPDENALPGGCLLYTSDAADERSSVDLGGRRIIKKKNSKIEHEQRR